MKKICDNLNKYYDNELSIEQREKFATHLNNCPECQTNLKFLNDIKDIGIYNFAEPPVFEQTAFLSRISSLHDFGYLLWQKFAIAACFILFAIVGSFGGHYFSNDYTNELNLDNNSMYSYLEENL